ncbi:unnamed protein product, partial [Mycena citricolor]
ACKPDGISCQPNPRPSVKKPFCAGASRFVMPETSVSAGFREPGSICVWKYVDIESMRACIWVGNRRVGDQKMRCKFTLVSRASTKSASLHRGSCVKQEQFEVSVRESLITDI